ncbi:MAG: CTP synthase [Helicobacteraceae bacterium]
MTKFIFVTGGVLSSLGKGITSASIAKLLRSSGLEVSMLKIDPYINVDPGTMSPMEHGEVFVTADGGETDLDIGHYERFLNQTLSKKNNITTGQIYSTVIEKERHGDYLGQTIQVVPHITDEIIRRIKLAGKDKDILVVELGGTIGDIEGLPFYEAVRQMKHAMKARVYNIHVTLVPYIEAADELKTKPTQHSVGELRKIGISPNMLVCRANKPLPKDIKKKLSASCDVEPDAIIEAIDAKSIYEIPLKFLEQDILRPITRDLELGNLKPALKEYRTLVGKILEPKAAVKIAFVGKYLDLKEAYKSLLEGLVHSGAWCDSRVEFKWVDSETLTPQNAQEMLSGVDGILVPGGFGSRGVEGKILAIEYARKNRVVFLGICLGMQLALIEFARNVLGYKGANSTEFDPQTKYPVVFLIDEFMDATGTKQLRTQTSPMGGTLRLGSYECNLREGSKLRAAFKEEKIMQRHRHRYEANPAYKDVFEQNGMMISGESKGLMEACELREHPWFVAVQFHPEFTSHLEAPSPIILSFIEHCLKFKK